MYTTIKGNKLAAVPWRSIERIARKRFDGSMDLFDECFAKYRELTAGAIDDPEDIEDVMGWLDSLAAEKVNDSGSDFYMYG